MQPTASPVDTARTAGAGSAEPVQPAAISTDTGCDSKADTTDDDGLATDEIVQALADKQTLSKKSVTRR
jgi:hypothetical protein